VAARAFRNTTAQTILTNATTVVVLNGLSYDTHGGFNLTTGEYTIRVPGYYRVNAMLYLSAITAGEAVGVYIMKGSSTVSEPFIRASSAGDAIPTLSTTVYCNAGEVLKLAVDSAADTSFDVLATSKVSYMEIERVSGPSAIAASETVAAEYSSSAGLSIPDASNRYLDFPTKINDTHGAVVGAGGGNAASATSTWRFVAPISGRYLVVGQCNVVMSGTTNGLDLFVSITVNGSVVRRGSRTAFPSTSTGNAYSSMVVGEVSVLAGDYISISVYQSSGGARNQEGSAAQNYVNIVRVGN
jgi:hypothetical protein